MDDREVFASKVELCILSISMSTHQIESQKFACPHTRKRVEMQQVIIVMICDN